jgi:5-methyltetrahydrofolate--homocysteine methyltransferase
MHEKLLKKLEESMVNLDYDEVVKISKAALNSGADPIDTVKALTTGVRKVGERYEKGEYFLSELILASESMNAGMEVLSPALRGAPQENVGKIVLCTVKGDLHDIGKNLAKVLLVSEGFEVFDLGIDVDAEKIVEKVKETGAQIIGLSALLSTTIPYIKKVIDELKDAHVRDNVKVIVGGAALDEKTARYLGADAFAADAVKGTGICLEWVKRK